ncbi:uncharacterized protein HMPREF1541_00548 [Cyphellophora europaea CBS 101466]|uniref:F-box domain-containing protein n=1 Tax=Cyphellophora europaea (strain CBS 101466) TaxID=1220924 RepID=W2SEQ8_CYPE1|nr:uncharacterized protein HMPREF1541_00548 [Cyphellophora europaea CBS 101466]ETN46364.1 hypothetical protein HMPREF1541_00548 [Cyphellophora europaea CBS 101466]
MTSKANLPDEVWAYILDFLDSVDLVSLQLVSRRLLTLARDNSLWRNKCFEKAPSASAVIASRAGALADLTGALGGLSLSEPARAPDARNTEAFAGASKRARRVARWDQSGVGEEVDWYSDFIARNAPLHTVWSETSIHPDSEICGVAVDESGNQAIGCREDGSVAIWDIREQLPSGRRFRQVAQSAPGVLFQSLGSGPSSSSPPRPSFSGVVECVNLDSLHNRAYIAVDRTLNEVDLGTLEVISQESYAWNITAVSQQGAGELPLSIGTTWSLHLYDPRVAPRDRSRSPEDLMRSAPGEPEDSIAFLPNYTKDKSPTYRRLPTGPAPTAAQLATAPSLLPAHSTRGRVELSDYAHVEPGPLSILHHGANEILVAGRFPSILSYDRRYFPRLQYVMHSGARLSSMTTIPYAPKAARSTNAEATLVACGEYGGRGSLELYSLPHDNREKKQTSGDYGLGDSSPELGAADRDFALDSHEQNYPFSYKNRQEASSAKLLSVATQGTRIVFSDAEGGLKWVERDGRGLARRWNINSFVYNERGFSASGELVARKIVPLGGADSGRGKSGNGDLLIYTGDKLGIVSTKPEYMDHAELVKAVDNFDLGDEEDRQKAEEYSKTMRKALERQADERRWMSQFRLKRGLF